MKKIVRILSLMLTVVLLLCNLAVSAETKEPTVIISSKNVAVGETGGITLKVENFDTVVGGFNFEIRFPEIAEITNVYLNGVKLTSLAYGGSDYNIRANNTLVLAGTCNYGSKSDLGENTVYHIEFIIAGDTKVGEYPVEFTENTFIVLDSDDEEFVFPAIVNGKINVTDKSVYKADINESGKADATDIAVLKKWLIGADYGKVFNEIAADVNEDKTLDIKDLVAIKKYLAQSVVKQTKTLPDTGGVVEVATGGAEAEAKALRTAIDTAGDNITVSGKKYYVSQNGNDNNDGTSPEKAFKTLDKVDKIYGSLKAGDAVLFERGSVFRMSFDLILKSGVTYGAYGQGAKPQIYGSERNYADKSLWTLTEIENVWRMNFSSFDAGIIVLDGGKETGKKQMYLYELTVNDDFYHDWDNNMLYFYCDKGNPAEMFDQIEIGVKKEIFHIGKNAHDINIDNISFSYSGIFGIRGYGNSQNISVTNCAFSWIGGSLFDDKSNRYGNAIEFTNGCEDIIVKNCSFYQIFDTGVTFQVGNVPYRDFVVENCLFEYNGMSGFEWWAQGDEVEENGVSVDPTVIENISFKNNIVRLTGYGWSKTCRSPAHIRSGWRAKSYPNLKNFVISGNIFDCANGQIIASCCTLPSGEYSLRNNTYYQRNIRLENGGVYLPFTSLDVRDEYVSNYEEFIWAVCMNDESPRKIVWLE